jgi:phasin family protein
MQQKNPAGNFFNDMQSAMKQMMEAAPSANPFDFKAILETQRKNMQALTEANQCAMNSWQALTRRQAEMVSEFVQDNSGRARDAIAESGAQEKLTKQAEMLKAACEQSIENTRELAEIVRKSSNEISEIVNGRLFAGMGEARNAAVAATKKKA